LPIVIAFKQKNSKLQIDEASLKINSRVRVPITWREAADMFSPSYYRNLLYKREKHAYVDTFEGVQNIMFQLKLHLYMDRNAITVSKKPYTTLHEEYFFYSMPWSASVIYLRLRCLFQSGIITLWRLWKFRIDTWNDTVITARQEINELKPLSTNESNLVVVFYLHAIVLGLSVVTLVVEARLKIVKKLISIVACTNGFGQTAIKHLGKMNCKKPKLCCKLQTNNGIIINVNPDTKDSGSL